MSVMETEPAKLGIRNARDIRPPTWVKPVELSLTRFRSAHSFYGMRKRDAGQPKGLPMRVSSRTRTATRRSLSRVRLKRLGLTAVVAVCKAALVLAMLEAAGQPLESSAEACESLALELELANPLEGQIPSSRNELASNLAVRCLGRARGSVGNPAARGVATTRADGHRLPNGLCAPMQC